MNVEHDFGNSILMHCCERINNKIDEENEMEINDEGSRDGIKRI